MSDSDDDDEFNALLNFDAHKKVDSSPKKEAAEVWSQMTSSQESQPPPDLPEAQETSKDKKPSRKRPMATNALSPKQTKKVPRQGKKTSSQEERCVHF